jgi:putative transposase
VRFLIGPGVSPRRACQLLQSPRSTFQYQARPDRNADLAEQVRGLAAKHPRYGESRIHALLRRKQKVNKKRIHRLWQLSRLQVQKRPRKRLRMARSDVPVKATHPNHVWTYDFLEDHCQNGTVLPILTVMDEFTFFGLAIEVATSISASGHRGGGAAVCGPWRTGLYSQRQWPEFIALALQLWLAGQHVMTL